MKWNYKSNVIMTGINPLFLGSLWLDLASLIHDITKGIPTITAGLDGVHSANSKHYVGKAVDVRIKDWKCDINTMGKIIARYLGKDFVVVQEPDHLHIQIGKENINGKLEEIGTGFFIKSKRC